MSRGCCTQQHVLVTTGHAARENQRREGRVQLARKNSQETFIRGAIHGRCGDAHLQASVANLSETFGRGARPDSQAQQQVRSLDRAPRSRLQRRRICIAWMAMRAHSGEKSMSAIGGMNLRKGRSTGSQSEPSSDCTGE